jgi:acetyltransferase
MEHAQDTQTLRDRLEAYEVRLAGKDGRSYAIRPIRTSDAASLMRGYDAMSDSSKWFRLLHAVPHLTEAMALEFCSPDPKRDICVVLEGCDELEGEILDSTRISGSPDGARAEFSVSLRPEAQGLGLAIKALETVFAVAKEMRYAQIYGSINRRNEPMLRLAESMGFHLGRDPEDPALMVAELSL